MSLHFQSQSPFAGSDGASEPALEYLGSDPEDLDLMLKAWTIERQASIEMELLLARSTRLLSRLVREDGLSETRKVQVRHLLDAIDAVTSELHDGDL